MNFVKLPKKDIQSFDLAKLHDTAKSLRKELVTLQMDVYNAGPQARSNARLMRKSLARLLTAANAKQNAAKAKK